MIAMYLGPLGRSNKSSCWAPISDADDFPKVYSKDLYRLDDGIGSGDVLIETSICTYKGVKLLARTGYSSSKLSDYSSKWPKGANHMVYGSMEPFDYLSTSLSSTKMVREAYIVFPIVISAGEWGSGRPASDSEFTCYMRVRTMCWGAGYKPRFEATLVGDAPTSGKGRILRVDYSIRDSQFPTDVPLDTVWSIVSDVNYLMQKLKVSKYMICTYDPSVANAKAYASAQCYLLDFHTATASKLSPDKGEYSFWFGRATGIINNPDGINPQEFSKAFYRAQDSLPEASQNQIANICDCVNSIRQFAKKPYITIEKGPKALKNAWLAYRYSYSTTKSDILELAQLSERLLNIGDVVKSFGSSSTSSARYYAEIVVDASYYMPAECSSLLRKFQQFGLKVNAQNAWDMVPYSFVVDWFLDVSSLLSSFDSWIAASSIPIKEVWYSCVTTYDDGRRAYFRWSGSPPALPSWSYHVSNNATTWIKRLFDVISLS